MTLSQWAESNRQTVYNPGEYPYVLLPEWPHQLQGGTISVLYELSDYTVDNFRGDCDTRHGVWLRRRVTK